MQFLPINGFNMSDDLLILAVFSQEYTFAWSLNENLIYKLPFYFNTCSKSNGNRHCQIVSSGFEFRDFSFNAYSTACLPVSSTDHKYIDV